MPEERMVDTPEYKGIDRRRVLILEKCVCHVRHEAMLKDHEDDIKELKDEDKHAPMWEDIKNKVPNRLFYLFVGIVIVGLAFVYDKVHSVDKAIAVISTEVKRIDKVEVKVDELHDDLEKHREEYRKANGAKLR